MSEAGPEKKVDECWKEEAAKEKERLAQAVGEKPTPPAPEPAKPEPRRRQQIPPASFEVMVEEYATQILLSLGAMPHPVSGQSMRDLAVAQHYIDLLGMLEAKTKGNLTPPEERMLTTVLYEMRMAYVRAAKG